MKPIVLTELDYLAAARYMAAKKFPAVARGLWAMNFVLTDEVPTCAVDEYWRVYFNPAYVMKCQKEGTLVGEIAHELSHPLLRHSSRGKLAAPLDSQGWNVAGDKEIDQQLLAARFVLVSNRVECPAGCEHFSAEEHYAHDKKQGKSKEQESKPGTCGGGSGTGGKAESWELGAPTSKAPGKSEAQAHVIRMQVAQAVVDRAKKKPGSVPAGMLVWAEAMVAPPVVPWDAMTIASVRYQLDAKRGSAPSYARPSRRNGGEIILPVRRTPQTTIAIVLDTSGSMMGPEHDLARGLGVVLDAVDTLGRVVVIPCDGAAYEPVEVRTLDDLKPFLKGGGGTSMTTGIARAVECDVDAVVVVTDGGTLWPTVEPALPLTVVLTQSPCMPTPKYATTVEAF